jgi:glycosyltransferase involved in cell wall biosynthesis
VKIVLAVHHFPPHRSAGGELQAYRTAIALQARGHQVCIVCVESIVDGTASGLTWRDDTYHGLAVRRLSFNMAAAPDPVRWEYDNLWIGEHLDEYLRQERPDLFHLYGGYLISGRALLVANQLGIATAVTLLDFWFLCRRFTLLRSDNTLSTLPLDPVRCARCLGESQRRYRLPGRLVPDLMHRFWQLRNDKVQAAQDRMTFLSQVLAQSDLIISQSRFVESVFVEAGMPQAQLVFCRQGQDLPAMHDKATAKKPSTTLRIGYLGQIAWHKGVHVLLEAVQKLPHADLRVTLHGDPTLSAKYTAKLKAIAADDPRVVFAGPFVRTELDAVLGELDIVIVPSLWYENSPNTIFEAFAHRTPVIATNLGGMAELVQHGQNGLVFALEDAADLARQLHRILDEPDLLHTLSMGIQPVKSIEQEIDELEALFTQMLDRRHNGAGQPGPTPLAGASWSATPATLLSEFPS